MLLCKISGIYFIIFNLTEKYDNFQFHEKNFNFRLTYGIGIGMKLGGIARIELNYCVPMRTQRGDRPAPGFQFGVGVDFL